MAECLNILYEVPRLDPNPANKQDQCEAEHCELQNRKKKNVFSFAGPIVLGGLADYGSSSAQWVKGRRVRVQEHGEWLCFQEHRPFFLALLRTRCEGS